MTPDTSHLTGPLTEAEQALRDRIVTQLKDERVAFGRAAYLFGTIAGGLVQHAVNQGNPTEEVVGTYFQLFATGMGVQTVEVVQATDTAAPPAAPGVRH
jgi:hypothetical protein